MKSQYMPSMGDATLSRWFQEMELAQRWSVQCKIYSGTLCFACSSEQLLNRARIATDTKTNATNISSLATKSSGLVAKMATCFSVLIMNNCHFPKYFVLLKNTWEDLFLKNFQNEKRSPVPIHPFTLLCLQLPHNPVQALEYFNFCKWL